MNTFCSVDNSLTLRSMACARHRVRLGLCCINNTLRNEQKIYVNRTITRKHFTVDLALERTLANVKDIEPILKWNHTHNIRHYRLSSDMFPHYLDKQVPSYEPTPDIIKALQRAGQVANALGHRITMHPGQYCVVAAKEADKFENTSRDLEHHAWILDTMNIGSEGILCIHGGGTYGDKEATKRRWIEQFDDLPKSVKRRIALENCEKSYSIEDCLEIAEACKIPVIYDSHHYYCYNHLHPLDPVGPIEELLPQIIETWDRRGANPLFHISDQADDKNVGAHHDFIKEIPAHLLNIPMLYDRSIDIEVEAKAKEDAILRLMKKYSVIFG